MLKQAGPKIHRGIPLTLADVSRAKEDPDRQYVFITGNWHFETCIVHVFVAGRGAHNKEYYKYIIDDGSASMEVSIPSNLKKHKHIASMNKEANVLASTTGTVGDKIMSGSLIRLLTKAKENIDASIILPGMSIFVDGRPNIFRGKVGLEAHSFCLDNETMEIAFADHLIDWQSKK